MYISLTQSETACDRRRGSIDIQYRLPQIWAQTAESQLKGALAPNQGKEPWILILRVGQDPLFPATRERAMEPPRNGLLAAMSSRDLALLKPKLEPVTLNLRKVLEPANKPVQYNYFLASGLASVIAIGKNGDRLEVGIIGREGMTGLPVVLGNDRSPNETFIQVEGAGARIAADDLRQAMRKSASLSRLLLNFVNAFLIQTSHTALSNGKAGIEERLARWLLMAQDRLDGSEVPLTHEFLSLMLGVRRAGVTGALNQLDRKGVIRLSRGRIEIVDRDGLINSANGTYGIPEAMARKNGISI
jgi:CRP-like cAMP-binding protein